jgi:hypothetical protein
MQDFQLFLADAILVTHALVVLFNIASLPAIWIGKVFKWRFVHNFYFRAIHLLLIGYIAAQALVGTICPLTEWENQLRLKAGAEATYAGSFIAHWVQWALFYEADERIFTAAYVIFFVLVLVTLFWVKPNPPSWWRKAATKKN